MTTTNRYVIWSEEHGGWWGPRRHGYTRKLTEAGRYEQAEAEEIVTKANKHSPSWNEVALPDPLP
jgi:hypothetical protein